MKAVRWHGRGDVRLDEVPDPDPPGPGEVVVRVLLTGVCGTDFEEVRAGPLTIPADAPHPLTGRSAPITLGHEVLGEVAVVGPDVVDLAFGDRVVLDGLASCGECESCRRGRPTLCSRLASIGLHRDGGMAEYLAVPAATCVPVPDSVPDELAVLAEPLAVAVRAVRRARIAPDDRVLVIGVGAVGRCVAAVALLQAASVAVQDASSARIANARVADPRLQESAGTPESADVVFDCAGTEVSFARALEAAARGGIVVLVGVAESVSGFSPLAAALKELTIVTSLSHDIDDDTRAAVDLLASGKLALSGVVAQTLRLEDAPGALVNPPEAPGKLVVSPRS